MYSVNAEDAHLLLGYTDVFSEEILMWRYKKQSRQIIKYY